MSAPRTFAATVAILAVSAAATGQAAQQDAAYMNHAALTGALQQLASSNQQLVTMRSIAKSDAGRDIWVLTLANRGGRDPASRPALLIVANVEGNHLIGSSVALHTVRHLLASYPSDESVRRILDERTVYVIPRANPDGAELAFTMREYEIPFKPHPSAPARGGLNIGETGADLNGDGFITMMRVRHPDGTYMADADEPRLMRTADRTRAERGMYKLFVEGSDTLNAAAYIPSGSDGVNLNRNFQHEYLYFQPHTGPHMVSEVESRALVDFVFDHTNIAAVLTYSAYDNLLAPPPAQRAVPQGVTGNPPNVPTNILPADRPYYEFISSTFQRMTELRGEGADGEAGSFPQFVYYQAGLPSFTTPVWSPAPAATAAQRTAHERDRRWLAHLDQNAPGSFVNWTAATHPTLGAVEVGGFRPNSRVNPPAALVGPLATKHTEFSVWLAQQLPEVAVAETAVERRGDNVFLVSAVLTNEQYLPTHLAMGERTRFNRPISVRILPAPATTILTGNPQEQFSTLQGMGGRRTFTWLIQAAPGTQLTLEVFAERAGGLLSRQITLR